MRQSHIITHDNTLANLQIRLLLFGVSSKCFFTGVDLVGVDLLILCFTALMPEGFFHAAIAASNIVHSTKIMCINIYSVYRCYLFSIHGYLDGGFATHNRSFVTKIKKSLGA